MRHTETWDTGFKTLVFTITSHLSRSHFGSSSARAERRLLLGLPFRPSITSHGDDLSSVQAVASRTRVESGSKDGA